VAHGGNIRAGSHNRCNIILRRIDALCRANEMLAPNRRRALANIPTAARSSGAQPLIHLRQTLGLSRARPVNRRAGPGEPAMPHRFNFNFEVCGKAVATVSP
jgi:hypothetical protein